MTLEHSPSGSVQDLNRGGENVADNTRSKSNVKDNNNLAINSNPQQMEKSDKIENMMCKSDLHLLGDENKVDEMPNDKRSPEYYKARCQAEKWRSKYLRMEMQNDQLQKQCELMKHNLQLRENLQLSDSMTEAQNDLMSFGPNVENTSMASKQTDDVSAIGKSNLNSNASQVNSRKDQGGISRRYNDSTSGSFVNEDFVEWYQQRSGPPPPPLSSAQMFVSANGHFARPPTFQMKLPQFGNENS